MLISPRPAAGSGGWASATDYAAHGTSATTKAMKLALRNVNAAEREKAAVKQVAEKVKHNSIRLDDGRLTYSVT